MGCYLHNPEFLLVGIFISFFLYVHGYSYCSTEKRPGIRDSEVEKTVFLNDRLILSCCMRDSRSMPFLRWITPAGHRVGYLGKNSEDQNEYTLIEKSAEFRRVVLVINRVSSDYNGVFTCRDDNLATSASITVKVLPRVILEAPPVQWAQYEAPGEIRCDAPGQSGVEITWFRERDTIPVWREGIRVGAIGGVLRFASVTFEDAGAYVCKGELISDSDGGELEVRVVVLQVYQIPVIKEGPKVVTSKVSQKSTETPKAIQGHVNKFECVVRSRPSSNVTWYIDDKLVTTTSADDAGTYFIENRLSDGQTVSTLRITNFLNGPYVPPFISVPTIKCVANLVIPETKLSVTESNSFQPAVIFRPRIIERGLLVASAKVGDKAQLICRAQGADASDIFLCFERNGLRVADYGQSGRVRLYQGSNTSYADLTMAISDINPSDSGTYTCVAETLAGSDRFNGTMIVYYPPVITMPTKPVFEYGWFLHTTQLRCEAKGNPAPAFYWSLNGATVDALGPDNTVFKLSNQKEGDVSVSVLSIKPDLNGQPVFGRYVCTASNDLSTARSSDMIVVEARRPGLPEVQIESDSPTNLVLLPSPPEDTGGVELLGYELYYRIENGSEVGPAMFQLNRRIRVRYMKPLTNYRFYIAARNLIGAGPRMEINYTTGALTKPSDFKILADFVSQDPYSFLLKWNIIKSGGLPVDRYKIKIREVVGYNDNGHLRVKYPISDWVTINPYLPVDQNHFRIKNLQPGTYYEVQVQIGSALGLSDKYKVHVFRTAAHPGLINVIGSSLSGTLQKPYWLLLVTSLILTVWSLF